MSSDRAPNSLVSAWQEQSTSGFRMVPSDFARKIRRDVRASPWGFWIFLVFFAVMIISAGAKLFAEADPVRRVGHILAILALVVFVGQILVLRRRVRAVRSDVLRTTSPSLEAARAYLIARRAFHSGRWLWSRIIVIFPVVPILTYGAVRNDPDLTVPFLTGTIIPWVALLAFAAFIVQRGAARAYERLLRELDDIERQSPLERFMASHEEWKSGREIDDEHEEPSDDCVCRRVGPGSGGRRTALPRHRASSEVDPRPRRLRHGDGHRRRGSRSLPSRRPNSSCGHSRRGSRSSSRTARAPR